MVCPTVDVVVIDMIRAHNILKSLIRKREEDKTMIKIEKCNYCLTNLITSTYRTTYLPDKQFCSKECGDNFLFDEKIMKGSVEFVNHLEFNYETE